MDQARKSAILPQRAKIAEGGRLLVPAEFRRRLGLNPGDTVIMRLDDGELRVRSLRQAVEQAQKLLDQYVPKDVSLAEELIQDRRAEAARD